jgi:hypothetical protein
MDLLEAVRRRAWDSRFYDLPPEAKSVPTMLTPEEGKMLCWLGEHYFQGEGAVVELGSFLGGSTVRLASGLARSGRPWKMESFDRFEIDEIHKQRHLYSNGYEKFEGSDMLSVFEKHIQPFSPNIIPHKGDVENFPWQGGAIEILFIDLAKTPKTNGFILESFFKNLIPNRSIIIQQDYLHFQTPWLVATMELLHPKIELVSWTRDYSVLFVCNEIPTAEELDGGRYNRLSVSEVERLFVQARDRFPFEWQREMVAVSLDSYLRSPREQYGGHYRPDWSKPPSLGPWAEPAGVKGPTVMEVLARLVRPRRR